MNDSAHETDDNDNKINKTMLSKSFEYKTKIIGGTPNNNILDAEVVVSLKYFSNFWASLDFPLINCEIQLELRWRKNCVISKISRIFRAVDDLPVQEVATKATGAAFQINNVKLYVSVVTLLINDNIEILENVKQWFKRTISWEQIWIWNNTTKKKIRLSDWSNI